MCIAIQLENSISVFVHQLPCLYIQYLTPVIIMFSAITIRHGHILSMLKSNVNMS